MIKEKDIHGKKIKVGDLLLMIEDKEFPEGIDGNIPTGSLGIVVGQGCYHALWDFNGKVESTELEQEDADVEILESHGLKYWGLNKDGTDIKCVHTSVGGIY